MYYDHRFNSFLINIRFKMIITLVFKIFSLAEYSRVNYPQYWILSMIFQIKSRGILLARLLSNDHKIKLIRIIAGQRLPTVVK